MWTSTRITELLGIQYPILLGPMGGGFSTIALLAAVSNAGGLGSYGAYTLTPEQIRHVGVEAKQATSKPFNINLWVSDVDPALQDYPADKLEKITRLFKPYFDEAGIPLPTLHTTIPSKFEQQLEVVFEMKPAVLSFIFGIPSKEVLQECRRLGIKTVGAATTLEEGLALEAAQVDAIVAAGFEAGGHRPSFLRPAPDSLSGVFTLIQQLKAHIQTPVIAAGGITNGRSIAAAFTLGADAVQLSTAFLATPESGAHTAHKAALLAAGVKPTVLSKSLTGRMGRMIENHIATAVPYTTEVLPFPLQTQLLAPLKAAALAQGKTELVNFWSGQNNMNLRQTDAASLLQLLVRETQDILGS